MLDSKVHWILSGSKLSPFHLKVAAMLKFKGVPYRDFPSEGGFFENISIAFRTQLLKRGLLTLTYPKFTELDEFPLVPFLFGPKGENLFDSSSIAVWLDQNKREANRLNLVTIDGDEAINFLIQLVDDYFDEFGLYMVHHARWKISASDNKAGEYLANELSLVVGPLKPLVAKVFSARQVRRCPYLFSVAPEGYRVEGLSNERQPPSHKDFPETHRLLEQRYLNILTALETIFSTRPYLFGHCFTLADASVYGQLGMNLADPTAAKLINDNAPHVYQWLNKIHIGDFSEHNSDSPYKVDDLLQPLITEISQIFYPLMNLNEAAYVKHKKAGEELFNEQAFTKGRSLYHGIIGGYPFVSVVKTFQVKTWRKLKKGWNKLDDKSKSQLLNQYSNINPTVS